MTRTALWSRRKSRLVDAKMLLQGDDPQSPQFFEFAESAVAVSRPHCIDIRACLNGQGTEMGRGSPILSLFRLFLHRVTELRAETQSRRWLPQAHKALWPRRLCAFAEIIFDFCEAWEAYAPAGSFEFVALEDNTLRFVCHRSRSARSTHIVNESESSSHLLPPYSKGCHDLCWHH